MGSSKCCTETSHRDPKTFLYFGKTIFDTVEEAGMDWRYYFKDAPLEAGLIAKVTFNLSKLTFWKSFQKDAAEHQCIFSIVEENEISLNIDDPNDLVTQSAVIVVMSTTSYISILPTVMSNPYLSLYVLGIFVFLEVILKALFIEI